MERIKLSQNRDSLLLVFRESKVSLVEYDPFNHELKTLALRSLEKDEYKDGFEQMVSVPLIKVDPLNRCAAVLVYGKQLAIIPFVKRDSGLADLADVPPSLGRQGSQLGHGGQSNTNISGQLDFYTIRLRELDEEKGVNNVHDMAFLDGYYEPTLLLLYEPVATWAGRVAIRQDTCAIMALSLNVYQRVHPPVWSYCNLPYNSFKVLPVPKPIGGVLIVSVNALLYLNQSVPPYGVSLNSFTEVSTAFPLKQQPGIRIVLDACRCEFLADDRIVFSLKNGDIFVLTLFTDGMRSICKFIFNQAASSVLTTCLTLCEPGYLFLGSRLGNSLLLRYTETDKVEGEEPERDEPETSKVEISESSNGDGEQGNAPASDGMTDDGVAEESRGRMNPTEDEHRDRTAPVIENSNNDKANENARNNEDYDDEPAAKKQKIGSDNIDEWAASNVDFIEDAFELKVYGQSSDEPQNTKLYKFEMADALQNIGPIIRMAMGEPAFQSGLSNKTDTDVEIATVSGHGRNGALCVLQRTIKPQVITTFELPGCADLWTVCSSTTRSADSDEGAHQFLILSRSDSTMILQTGQEINELDHSGFCTQSPTIFAGNLADGRYVIQVCPGSVRLLEGTRQLQQVPIDVGSPLVAASLADPHILVMSADGLVIHLTLRGDDSRGYKLSVLKPQFPGAKSKITAHCIYKDISGLFVTKNLKLEDMHKPKKNSRNKVKVAEEKKVETSADFGDEDELLYGSSVDIKDLVAGGLSGAHIVPSAQGKDELGDDEAEENIRTIAPADPTYWVFLARENGALEIYSLPDYKLCYFVKNFPLANKVLQNASLLGQATSTVADVQLPKVMEIFMCALGMHSSRPLLFARIDSDLHIYEVYPFYEKQKEGHLKIQFRRLPHAVNMEPRRVYKQKENDPTLTLRWIRPFHDVSGYNGVFVCGRRPYWVFMTARGELRAHPMLGDGRIYSFATFHNVNCSKGFLFFNKYGELRICTLPTHLSYDAPWPTRKVPLKCTPHFINYHVDSRTYCVVTSTQKKATTLPRLAGEDKEFEPIIREGGRFIAPTVDRFTLELWSPVSWESIPKTRMDMDEWEKVMCVKNVMIASEGTTSGEKGLLAVGTIYNYGEDCTAKGRIILLDIIEVVPEPGQPLTRSKVKTILSKSQNAPVTALCSVKGHLMAAVGQKLFLFQLKDNDLVGMAFLDTQVYILTAISLKSFILIGDVYKSITLLRYQEESKTFAVVSKDTKPLQVYAVEYLIDSSQMAFLVSDSLSNLMVYMYQPENRETLGGQRLVRRGDFNIGSRVNSMFRIRCRLADIPRSERRLLSMVETRHVTVYASLDGSLGYLLPIAEKTYRRLLMLQNVLNSYASHVAGLNPRGFRLMQSEFKELTNPQKNVIDGDLINDFMDLNFNEKAEVARKIGTTVHQIQLDLAEIEGLTCHF
ncbi:cleavage and polyadenylation specificity factor subunit 1-like isoform X2 [Varroa destructor]|nr:cleavage and polyadenylation specificity factor subunit 1-like isoform X2 [Varroa destructor]